MVTPIASDQLRAVNSNDLPERKIALALIATPVSKKIAATFVNHLSIWVQLTPTMSTHCAHWLTCSTEPTAHATWER